MECLTPVSSSRAPLNDVTTIANRPKQPDLGQVRAIYSYTSAIPEFQPGDLSFHEGDVITLTRARPHKNWWRGTCHGRKGAFPKCYVSDILPRPSVKPCSPPPADETSEDVVLKFASSPLFRKENAQQNHSPMVPKIPKYGSPVKPPSFTNNRRSPAKAQCIDSRESSFRVPPATFSLSKQSKASCHDEDNEHSDVTRIDDGSMGEREGYHATACCDDEMHPSPSSPAPALGEKVDGRKSRRSSTRKFGKRHSSASPIRLFKKKKRGKTHRPQTSTCDALAPMDSPSGGKERIKKTLPSRIKRSGSIERPRHPNRKVRTHKRQLSADVVNEMEQLLMKKQCNNNIGPTHTNADNDSSAITAHDDKAHTEASEATTQRMEDGSSDGVVSPSPATMVDAGTPKHHHKRCNTIGRSFQSSFDASAAPLLDDGERNFAIEALIAGVVEDKRSRPMLRALSFSGLHPTNSKGEKGGKDSYIDALPSGEEETPLEDGAENVRGHVVVGEENACIEVHEMVEQEQEQESKKHNVTETLMHSPSTIGERGNRRKRRRKRRQSLQKQLQAVASTLQRPRKEKATPANGNDGNHDDDDGDDHDGDYCASHLMDAELDHADGSPCASASVGDIPSLDMSAVVREPLDECGDASAASSGARGSSPGRRGIVHSARKEKKAPLALDGSHTARERQTRKKGKKRGARRLSIVRGHHQRKKRAASPSMETLPTTKVPLDVCGDAAMENASSPSPEEDVGKDVWKRSLMVSTGMSAPLGLESSMELQTRRRILIQRLHDQRLMTNGPCTVELEDKEELVGPNYRLGDYGGAALLMAASPAALVGSLLHAEEYKTEKDMHDAQTRFLHVYRLWMSMEELMDLLLSLHMFPAARPAEHYMLDSAGKEQFRAQVCEFLLRWMRTRPKDFFFALCRDSGVLLHDQSVHHMPPAAPPSPRAEEAGGCDEDARRHAWQSWMRLCRRLAMKGQTSRLVECGDRVLRAKIRHQSYRRNGGAGAFGASLRNPSVECGGACVSLDVADEMVLRLKADPVHIFQAFDHACIATQLTMVSGAAFRCIYPEDFYQAKGHERSHAMEFLHEQAKRVPLWVATTVLRAMCPARLRPSAARMDVKSGRKALYHFLSLADHLFRMGSFGPFCMICAGIEHISLSRIAPLWEGMNASIKGIYNDVVVKYYNPHNDWAVLKAEISSRLALSSSTSAQQRGGDVVVVDGCSSTLSLPFYPICFSAPVARIMEINSAWVEHDDDDDDDDDDDGGRRGTKEKLVNVYLMNVLGSLFSSMHQYQVQEALTSTLDAQSISSETSALCAYLSALEVMGEKALDRISCTLYPKKTVPIAIE